MIIKKIYISGQMSGLPNYNYDAFNNAAIVMRKKGYTVINPAELGFVKGWEWVDYMRRDISELMKADCIVTLPNWEKSKGASIEVNLGKSLGFDVFPFSSFESQ